MFSRIVQFFTGGSALPEPAAAAPLVLSDAIQPLSNQKFSPGFRFFTYRGEHGGPIPVLTAAVPSEQILEIFYTFIHNLPAPDDELSVVLKTSHALRLSAPPGQAVGCLDSFDLRREEIERSVLMSRLLDYEDLLLHDGASGIAVYASDDEPIEVDLDQHKMLRVYAPNLGRFERILRDHDIPSDPGLIFAGEFRHRHNTSLAFKRRFAELASVLGAELDQGDDEAPDPFDGSES